MFEYIGWEPVINTPKEAGLEIIEASSTSPIARTREQSTDDLFQDAEKVW